MDKEIIECLVFFSIDTNKMWFFELATSLVGVLLLVSPGVISKTDVDVQGEINRITDKLNNIEPPNQMMIDAFVQQVQTYCPNRTIGQQVYVSLQLLYSYYICMNFAS